MSDRGFQTSRTTGGQIDDYNRSKLYGPDSHRGVLTITGKVDKRHMAARSGGDPTRKYPYSDRYSLNVSEDEITFHLKASRGKGNADSITFFGALNGLDWGSASTIEDLEDTVTFLGTSRSDFAMTDDPMTQTKVDETGCTLQTFGTTNISQAWTEHVFPGDRLVWRFPRRDDLQRMLAGRSTTSEPRQKITAVIEVLDWTGVKYMFHNAAQIVLRRENDIGISHHLRDYTPSIRNSTRGNGVSTGVPAYVRFARALRIHQTVTVLKGVEALHQREIITINDPWTVKKNKAEQEFLKLLVPTIKAEYESSPVLDASASPQQIASHAAVGRYLEALTAPKTDVTRGRNVGDPSDPRLSQPYAYFTGGAHFVDSGKVSTYTSSTRESEVVGALQHDQVHKLNQTLWLGSVLGVVETPYAAGSRRSGSEVVVNDVLNATMLGHAQPENRKMYTTGDGIETTAMVRLMEENKALKASLKKLQGLALEHMDYYAQGLCMLIDRETSDHVIGTAYSYAAPNNLQTRVDCCLGKK